MNWNTVLAFLDDILALGKCFEHNLLTLRQVFERFRSYQLKLKPKKCELFQRRVEFLGRIVGPDGLELKQSDIQVVLNWPRPSCTKDVEKFLGFVNYHRSFIIDYARRSSALYQLTGKNPFVWTQEQESAFEDLKSALTSPPVLGLPNSTDYFILDTDASDMQSEVYCSRFKTGRKESFAIAPSRCHQNKGDTAPPGKNCWQWCGLHDNSDITC